MKFCNDTIEIEWCRPHIQKDELVFTKNQIKAMKEQLLIDVKGYKNVRELSKIIKRRFEVELKV